MTAQEQNKIFEHCLKQVKASSMLLDLANKLVKDQGGDIESFLRGFAAKGMRQAYPELY